MPSVAAAKRWAKDKRRVDLSQLRKGAGPQGQQPQKGEQPKGGKDEDKSLDGLTDDQVVALIQKEAKAAGATLANDGKGGLDPRLALKVFRRDEFKCQVPGCKTAHENVDLDHLGGHPKELKDDPEASKWLKEQAAKGKENTEEGLHAICARHHDLVHDREREIEDGEKPEPMKK